MNRRDPSAIVLPRDTIVFFLTPGEVAEKDHITALNASALNHSASRG